MTMMKTSLASELVGERPLPFEIALLIGDPFWQRVRRTSRLLEERARRKGSILTPAEVHKMNVIYEGALKTMASKAADDLIGEDKEEKKSKKKKAKAVKASKKAAKDKDEKPAKKKEKGKSKKATRVSNKGTEEDIEQASKLLRSKVKSKIATSEFAAKHDLNPIVVMRAAKRLNDDKKSGIKAVQEGRFWHVQAR